MGVIIHDKREGKDFTSLTFSGYKKTEVIKEFIKCLNKPDIENALLWSVELICTGKIKDLWDTILLVMSKNIHIGNPKLPIYLAKRFESFRDIVQNGYLDNELELRNSHSLRELFAEIIIVICYSSKKPAFEATKVNRKDDFSLELMGPKLKADTVDYCKIVFREKDPNQILLPINEFAFHLKRKNMVLCCYWAEWLIEYDAICRKNKLPIEIQPRDFIRCDDKFKTDSIWMIWELMLDFVPKLNAKHTILQALLELFCLKYNFAQKKKRRYLLYFAIEMCTELTDLTIPIIRDSEKVKHIKNQIEKLYLAIQKYEQRPEVIYDKQKNLNNSLAKMKMLYNDN